MTKFFEKTRNLGFWSIDALGGGKIKKHFEDIKFILENPNSSETSIRKKIYLERILTHAIDSVPFYRDIKLGNNLQDFPVVNKNILREHIDEFISSQYSKMKLRYGLTSGSTGTPFKFYRDENKKLRNDADFLYFYGKGGYSTGQRLYFLRVWNELNKKSSLGALAKNLIMADTSNLSNSNIHSFLNRLMKDSSCKFILAYASSIETICSADLKDYSKQFNVQSIFTGAEVLTDHARKKVHDFFGCPVYSRYSNQENGLLAQQYSMDSNSFQINDASYHIELLGLDSDNHVEDGERGRIVVTDLFNFGMPMIRYDTGDIGVFTTNRLYNDDVKMLRTVEGRKTDLLFSTSGDLVSPHILTITLLRYENQIKQYQFIQNGAKEYCLKINVKNGYFDQTEKIITDLQKYFGSDAEIDIQFVDEIPLLASGKRQKVINNYSKQPPAVPVN